MFQELFDKLSDNSSVNITVMKSKDKLTVGLTPVMNVKDTVKDVIVPIVFTDTPENCAIELPKLIENAVPKVAELAEQIKANEDAIAADTAKKEEAKKAKTDKKKDKAAPKKEKVVTPPKPKAANLFG